MRMGVGVKVFIDSEVNVESGADMTFVSVPVFTMVGEMAIGVVVLSVGVVIALILEHPTIVNSMNDIK